MADTDTDALGPLATDLAKYGAGAAGTLGANQAIQAAYQAVVKNLQDRFADYDKLGSVGYKPITAQQLGPSALSTIQDDPQARTDEQASIAQLDNIAKSGGLTLADKAALNQLESTLNRNSTARRKGLANEFASRGQLGAGAQLGMDLDAQQNAAENANQRGESIAAQAQQRAVDAVLQKAGLSRNMSNDKYARDRAAAEAADSIARHNASMSTDASKYNNDLLARGRQDDLSKLRGETGLTDSMNNALLGSGKQQANTDAGLAYGGTGLIQGLSGAASGLGKAAKGAGGSSGGGGGSNDPGLDQSGQNDMSGNRGGAADLSGGSTDAVETSDPEYWNSYTG